MSISPMNTWLIPDWTVCFLWIFFRGYLNQALAVCLEYYRESGCLSIDEFLSFAYDDAFIVFVDFLPVYVVIFLFPLWAGFVVGDIFNK